MKWLPSILALLVLAGCSTSRKQPSASALYRIRTYTAKELGVTLVPSPSGKAVRWKEVVSSPGKVRLPLLPPPSTNSLQPYINARLNDKLDIPMSLDTGAAFTVINEEEALAAGVRIANPKEFKNTFVGIGGTEENFYGVIDQLRLGELVFKNVFCIVRRASTNAPMDNVIGMASLAKVSWFVIDFPRKEVTFATAGTPPALASPMPIPFRISSLQMHTELTINDEYQFLSMVDTGNDAALMFPLALLDEIGLGERARRGTPTLHGGAGGILETRTFTIPQLRLGHHSFTNVPAVSVPTTFPPTIGSGFFSNYALLIDVRGGKVTLGEKLND